MKILRLALVATLISLAFPAYAATIKPIAFTAEVWADNWFSLYVNGKKIGEDSVSINTQKSFNSETLHFTATYPLTIGFIAKDYVQSKSGLEYLGSPNQQIGDGGIIFQISESISKKIVALSDSTWKVKLGNKAPTNPDCEKSIEPDKDCKYLDYVIPSNWYSPAFVDKSWGSASIFTAAEVGPKDGYNLISWHRDAKFIWGSDLKLDNTIYLRKKVASPIIKQNVTNFDFEVLSSKNGILDANVTCDGNGKSPAVGWSNIPSRAKSLILIMDTIPGPPRPSETQSGNHYYFYKFNIPVTARGFAEGEIAPYAPPCSQGPGLKQYRFFLYALDRLLPSNQDFDAATLMKIGESEAIGKVMHSYGYVRKA